MSEKHHGKERAYRLNPAELDEYKRSGFITAYGQPMQVGDEPPIFTFGFVKPHAYNKKDKIMADIQEMSEERGSLLYPAYEKTYQFTREEIEAHYAVHRDKPFFEDLVRMSIEGPVYKFILTGRDAIVEFRKLLGATHPKDRAPDTLRYKYGESDPKRIAYNAIHGSDSLESFLAEVDLHFTEQEHIELGEQFWKRLELYRHHLETGAKGSCA